VLAAGSHFNSTSAAITRTGDGIVSGEFNERLAEAGFRARHVALR